MIRRLTAQDTAAYREIRLEMLQRDPASFWAKYDDVKDQPLSYFENILTSSAPYGAFVDGTLVAVAMWYRNGHGNAELTSVYARPAARGKGLARAVIQACIDDAALTEDILYLQVSGDNTPAVSLYSAFGFSPVTDRPDLRSGCDMLMACPLPA